MNSSFGLSNAREPPFTVVFLNASDFFLFIHAQLFYIIWGFVLNSQWITKKNCPRNINIYFYICLTFVGVLNIIIAFPKIDAKKHTHRKEICKRHLMY